MLEEQQENTMTEADQQRAREALAGLLVEYSDTDGPVTSYTTGPADGDEDAVLNLAERFAEVRADERAELQDRIEELEKNLSYEVEQKIKLADTLRDERAKRPDREQIDRIQFEIDNVHQIHGDTCLCGFTSSRSRSRTEHLTALFAEAVLALEPEAREEAGPALRIDDDGAHIYWADPVEGCWVAFRRVDRVGEEELPERRLPAPEAREEHRPVDIEPSDTVCAKCSRRQGDGTYAETVEWPCALAEAREEVMATIKGK